VDFFAAGAVGVEAYVRFEEFDLRGRLGGGFGRGFFCAWWGGWLRVGDLSLLRLRERRVQRQREKRQTGREVRQSGGESVRRHSSKFRC
jgi:hypothetical protein